MIFATQVTADSLHLRKGAGRSFDSNGFVSKNDTLQVLGIDATGTWLHVKLAGKAGKDGWCYAKYLLPEVTTPSPWLAIAVKEIGVKEYPGPANNHPRIQAYLASVNGLSMIDKSKDETFWCSCFVNWCMEQSNINGTDSAWAKEWIKWQNADTLSNAQVGDIAVFDRSSATSDGGHVGIYIATNTMTNEVLVLGGNQNDAVRYSWYPIDTVKNGTHYKLLSLRR